ncbi:MAG: hypothetical protein H0U16_13370, partial [Actinobacteria bacterium]|nr:hypothetical protein [Actinomycetota bacterium]
MRGSHGRISSTWSRKSGLGGNYERPHDGACSWARRRGSQENGARGLGQHFLKSHKLAASLVQRAGVSRSDLVIEVGAGEGILTAELARAAGRVLAVELDPALAIILIRRFSNDAGVSVVAGDFLDVPLPAQP